MYTRCRYTGRKILKSGLKLIGGKTKTRDMFYQLKPEDASAYLEPFLGSGNVLVGLEQGLSEYANDINPHVISFFEMMQDDCADLWEAIEGYVYFIRKFGGDFWKDIRDREPNISRRPVENAAWFYVITKYAMNGIYRRNKNGKCNSSWCSTVQGRGIFTREWFDAVRERIQLVSFTNADYREFLYSHNSDYNWAFIDPPYRACLTTYNGIKFSDKDHEELADLLKSAKFKWLLTINDDEFTRNLYRDCNIIQHDIFYSCSQTPAGRSARPELIVTNYDTPKVELSA